MTKPEESLSLPAFLHRAYGTPWVADLVRTRMLRCGQKLIAAIPIQAHATKDNRLLLAYRLEIDEGLPGAASTLPLFVHYAVGRRAPQRPAYRALEYPLAGGVVAHLKRAFLRCGDSCFLSAFPLDPEVKGLATLGKPGIARELLNRAASGTKLPHAASVTLSLLGYRPEKRAVFKVRAVQDDGRVDFRVLKLYRKNEAGRVAHVCAALSRVVAPTPGQIAWPLGVDHVASALVFPFIDGQTLHERVEQGNADKGHFQWAGTLLRELHRSIHAAVASSPPPQFHVLRTFRRADELAILDRWRRLLKQGNHTLYGSVARFLGVLARLGEGTNEPAALVHRDFYPKQVMFPWNSDRPVVIDVDTLAWGPPALDVGNFLAHLDLFRFSHLGDSAIRRLREAFLKGYGREAEHDPNVMFYELSSLVRVLCLAAVSPSARERIDPIAKRCRKLARMLSPNS